MPKVAPLNALAQEAVAAIRVLIKTEDDAAEASQQALVEAQKKREESNEAAWKIGERIIALKKELPRRMKKGEWEAFCKREFDKSKEWARQHEKVASTFTLEETRKSAGIKPLLATLKPARAKPPVDDTWRASWSGDAVDVPLPRWHHDGTTLLQGDAEHVLRSLPAGAFHGCLCDPPYGYGPNGESNAWVLPQPSLWEAVYRALMPGTLLLASTGRSYDEVFADIEAQGFYMLPPLLWVFPDPSKKTKQFFIDPYVVAGKEPLDGEAHAGWVRDQEVVDDDGVSEQVRRAFGSRKQKFSFVAWQRDKTWTPVEDATTWMLRGGDEDGTVGGLRLEPGQHYGNRMFFCRAHKSAAESKTLHDAKHPTLKPVALTKHLAQFILPPVPDAHLLVPFSGAGSEVIGARQAGWSRETGVEREAKWVEEARARIVWLAPNRAPRRPVASR
jgi:DNA modification methylase